MKGLTEFDVIIAQTEIEICASQIQRRLTKIKIDHPERLDLIKEFTEERMYLLSGIHTIKNLKEDYKRLSIRFQEVILENAYRKQNEEKIKEENYKLREQIDQMTKF